MLSKKKMSPVKTVFVPQFGSQLSQRHEPQTEPVQSSSLCRRNKHGKVTEKKRFILKVKLPTPLNRDRSRREEKKGEETLRWMSEPTEHIPKPSESRGGEKQIADTQSGSVGDVFYFSEGPTNKPLNNKGQAKLAVLRTISKMLEENQLIRQRVATLSQTSRGCTY